MKKLKIGDHVEIVKYGHALMSHGKENLLSAYPIIKEGNKYVMYDINPEMVGVKAVVKEISTTQGEDMYSLIVPKGKVAWYHREQLKLIPNED